ncbi:MAG: SDR family NAD(P)-dependent oxidoreductase [Chloroflexota bacterium]
MLLEGKVAFVSGTGPNIGAEIARTLGANGAKVVCLDLNQQYAEAAANDVIAKGSQAIAVSGNITQPGDMERAVAEAVRAFGGIDILVNDAAITDREPFLEAKLETWNQVLNVILTGTFVCSQQVARQMVSQGRGGAIVNLVSTSGHRGETIRIAYGVAKAGLLNLTRSMAIQLAPHGIRVNSVTPTQSGTPVGRPDVPPRSDTEPPKGIPLGRWGRPQDQAQTVLFLASPMSDFVTGVDIPTDGGLLAVFPPS